MSKSPEQNRQDNLSGQNNGASKTSTSKGKKAKDIMAKHISDKNDVISEEDFKNLDVNADTSDESFVPVELNEKGKDSNRPKDEDKDPKMVTPWDTISE